MLEDDFIYVIRKAFKGLGLAPAEAARMAGLSPNEVLAFSKGKFSADIARQLAPILRLNPEALSQHDRYIPNPLTLPGIHRLEMEFDGGSVNAWLVRTEEIALLFDTGCNSKAIAAALGATTPDAVFITHAHGDHIGANPFFIQQGIPLHGQEITNSRSMVPGDSIEYGSLKIRACDLSGHANPSLGYHIEGLEKPVLVTGDALFAGSMGGCANQQLYRHALARLKEVLTPLPDSTVLLPGHGPATTLGEERVANPFL